MKWMKILASALALSTFAIAQDNCSQKLDVLEKSLPQGSAQIRLTIAEARASAAAVQALKEKDSKDPRIASKEESCRFTRRLSKPRSPLRSLAIPLRKTAKNSSPSVTLFAVFRKRSAKCAAVVLQTWKKTCRRNVQSSPRRIPPWILR